MTSLMTLFVATLSLNILKDLGAIEVLSCTKDYVYVMNYL